MDVVVMGSGGLGGYYGGLLARAGHRVTFVARGAHLDAIRRQGGIQVRSVHGDFTAPAEATDTPASAADLVLFTVKSYDTETAAALTAPAVGPESAVLSLQNGVDNEEVLARRFSPERVLGGLTYILSTIQEPGVVEQTAGPRTVVFGEWVGGSSERVRQLERVLQAAGILATASDDIIREKWVKFSFICALGGLTALTRLPIGEIRSCPPTWTLVRQVIEEVVAVGRARGVPLGADVVEKHMTLAAGLEPGGTSSLYYDLTHGKRLEIEALHGTAVRYGQEAGVPTPGCAVIYAALLPHDRRPQATPPAG